MTIDCRRATAALLAVLLTGGAVPGGAQPVPPPPVGAGTVVAQAVDVTPSRISYLSGDVAFWRPGAEDWAPARLNTPLAPGDALYAGEGGNVEIQIGPRAFVRAGDGTQIVLDSDTTGFVQLRLTGGHAAVDLRSLPAGSVVELDTPSAAFSIARAGYYHADVGPEVTAFRTHRGGSATATLAGGTPILVPADRQVLIGGTEPPVVTMDAAPPLTPWDRWNHQRTDYLVQPSAGRYVAATIYGAEGLDQYGTWHTVPTYGAVWMPAGLPSGWAPYSGGRWIWDVRFGWTWLDDAPWGWAPYHYGRWVVVNGSWAWAPGPIVARPVYAPALVVFLGGEPAVVSRPLCWAPLGWGEPVIPWWGPPGFVGVAWWGGWGGPRIRGAYRHVHVTHAVYGIPVERFGHASARPARIAAAEARELRVVSGRLDVKPVPASVMPAVGPALRPPPEVHGRPVVATRPPQDFAPALRAQGLRGSSEVAPQMAPRLVTPPARPRATESAPPHAASPAPGPPRPSSRIDERKPAPGDRPRIEERRSTTIERSPAPVPPRMAPPAPGAVEQPVAQPKLRSAPPPTATPPPSYVPRPMPGAGSPGRPDSKPPSHPAGPGPSESRPPRG